MNEEIQISDVELPNVEQDVVIPSEKKIQPVCVPLGETSDKKHKKEEDEEDAGEIIDDTGKFRLHTRTVCLTYADPDGWFSDAIDMGKEMELNFAGEIEHLVIGWEPYPLFPNRTHAHVYILFHHKQDIKNCRTFDMYSLHPWFKRCKKPKNYIRYCSKSAHLGYSYFNNAHLDVSTYIGFDRREIAFNRWTIYVASISRKDFKFPITIYGATFNFQFSTKRRHFWIYGPPDCGKSTNIGADFFDAQHIRYFEPGNPATNGRSDGTFDNYQQEQIILYDDRKLDWETLQRITDYKGATPKSIGIRGRFRDPIFSKPMVAIVLSNYPPGGQENQDWEKDIPAFGARFNVIEIEKGPDGLGKIKQIR